MPQPLQFHQDATASARPPAIPKQQQPTEADMLASLDDRTLDILSLIPQPSPEFRLAAIRKTIFALSYFENPTQEEWLAAIDSNAGAPYFLQGLWSKASMDIKVAATIVNPSIITEATADKNLELIAWLATYLRAGTATKELHAGPCLHPSAAPYFLSILTDKDVASQIALCRALGQSPREFARTLVETSKGGLPDKTPKPDDSDVPAAP